MRKTKYTFILRRYLPITKKITVALVVLFILSFIFQSVKNAEKFKIKSYTVSGLVKFVDAKDFEKVVMSNVVGQNIFKIDTGALGVSLKKNFQGINTIKIQKKYFDTLIFQIQERVPMAIVSDNTQTKYLVDIEGYVLGLVEDSYFDLPSLNYEQELHVGQFIDSKIVPVTLEIINQSKIEDVQVSSVSFKPTYSTFYAKQSIPVYMNTDANIKDSVKIVSRLLSKAALDGKNISKIDLRYDKVIVLYY